MIHLLSLLVFFGATIQAGTPPVTVHRMFEDSSSKPFRSDKSLQPNLLLVRLRAHKLLQKIDTSIAKYGTGKPFSNILNLRAKQKQHVDALDLLIQNSNYTVQPELVQEAQEALRSLFETALSENRQTGPRPVIVRIRFY